MSRRPTEGESVLEKLKQTLLGRKETGPFRVPGQIHNGSRLLALASDDLSDLLFHVQQIRPMPGGEIVQTDDSLPKAKQLFEEIGSNEARNTCDQPGSWAASQALFYKSICRHPLSYSFRDYCFFLIPGE